MIRLDRHAVLDSVLADPVANQIVYALNLLYTEAEVREAVDRGLRNGLAEHGLAKQGGCPGCERPLT